ncbi:MAG: arginase family protein [Phycisphaerales bacterium]|jgi:formiminoglutamase
MEVPYATPPQTPIEPHAARFSSTVKPISEYQPDPNGRRAVVILGMPDDTGVKLNNGRPGAKEGPGAIRRALSRIGVDRPATFEWPTVYDAGDVLPAGDNLDETHRRVSEASAALARAGLLPIGLGGGHDLTFAFVRGVIDGLPEEQRPRVGTYLDPHLDVRETTGSGMPFRRLVEDCGVRSLRLAGFDPIANTAAHLDWFRAHGGELIEVDAAPPPTPFFASLDMDVLDAAHAPGVSALNPCGLTPREAVGWARRAAASSKIRCFDVMELSPPNDDRDRTTRLAAYIVLAVIEQLEGQRL